MHSDTAILIVSCDKYKDVWDIFFSLFDVHWPNCDFKIYFGTNLTHYENKNFPELINIQIGKDNGWADGLIKMLDFVEESYVLLILDDYLLVKDVDNTIVHDLSSFAHKNDLGCLRLSRKPVVKKRSKIYKDLFILRSGDPYNVSLKIAIWKKSFLKKFLLPGYSAWDFEIKNSRNKFRITDEPIYTITFDIFTIMNGIVKGHWLRSSTNELKKIGFKIDEKYRSIIDDKEINKYKKSVMYLVRNYLSRNTLPFFRTALHNVICGMGCKNN